MDGGTREITSVTVTLTLELSDLGTFGPGVLFAQAQHAAAGRLGQLLGIDIDPQILQVEAISTKEGTGCVRIDGIGSRFPALKSGGK